MRLNVNERGNAYVCSLHVRDFFTHFYFSFRADFALLFFRFEFLFFVSLFFVVVICICSKWHLLFHSSSTRFYYVLHNLHYQNSSEHRRAHYYTRTGI